MTDREAPTEQIRVMAKAIRDKTGCVSMARAAHMALIKAGYSIVGPGEAVGPRELTEALRASKNILKVLKKERLPDDFNEIGTIELDFYDDRDRIAKAVLKKIDAVLKNEPLEEPKVFSDYVGYHNFINESGETYGSFEVFWMDSDIPEFGGEPRNYDSDGEPIKAGWYWWPCFPDCLPDSDTIGPFSTSYLAYLDARSDI